MLIVIPMGQDKSDNNKRMITVKEETLRVTDTDSNTNQQALEKFEKLITLPN